MLTIHDFTIRNAVYKDLGAIVRIYNSTIASRMVTADTEEISIESREQWFEEHSLSRPIWVAERAGQICGWLSLQSFYGRPAYGATVEVSIYIDQACRGKGLGQLLLNLAIEQSSQLGIKTLLGFIFSHNQPSLALFYKCGFADWGLLPNIAELDGVERSLTIVGRRVD